MTENTDALHLAWLADRFRAQATLGLHYRPDEADHARFERLRHHAAELAALVDSRNAKIISEHFREDNGIHTPKAAVAMCIETTDGGRVWRTMHLPPGRLLPDQITMTASTVHALVPAHPDALTDSHALALPDPHTHLIAYKLTSALGLAQLGDVWPEPDTALQQATRKLKLEGLPENATGFERAEVTVSAEAGTICAAIARLAGDGATETNDPYNVERFTHLVQLASNVVVGEVDYKPFESVELCPVAAATGAETAVFDPDGRMLLIRRSDTGQWAMPGGACEVGEPWAATAAREVFEEVGLELDPRYLHLVDVFDNRAITSERTTIPVIAVFAVELPKQPNTTLSREVRDTAWVTRKELDDLDLFAGHRIKATKAFTTQDR